jgi:hypothetical protein
MEWTCKTCYWSGPIALREKPTRPGQYPLPNGYVVCMRNAPIPEATKSIDSVWIPMTYLVMWPRVQEDDRCGSWLSKSAAAAHRGEQA